jgi:hypothetical protein
MPIALFEALCVAVIAITLALMARTRRPAELALEYTALAAAAWIGEETCVAWYGHYHYAAAWHGRLARVPALVALIWPLVVLSARGVVSGLWPAARGAGRVLAVGLVVTIDASLVEVVAVRAGLWAWTEGGHLGVPLIGIFGWGAFAASAEACALAGAALPGRARRLGPLLTPALAPWLTHGLLVAAWWLLLRHVLRGDLGWGSVLALPLVGGAAAAAVVRARRAGGAVGPATAAPRAIAALLFLSLLLATAPAAWPLWLHVAAVSAPAFAALLPLRPRSVPSAQGR